MRPDLLARTALAHVPSDVQLQFASAPTAALRSLGLKVQRLTAPPTPRADGGACDGVSFLDDNVVMYVTTPHSRRENFTLAHELGHWAVNNTPGVLDLLADAPNPGSELEAVCDEVARQILLPDDLVRSVIGAGPVSAAHVQDLFEVTSASRQACVIAVAGAMTGIGAVIVVTPDGHAVQFASVQPDRESGWPAVFPRRGQEVPAGHPLRVIQPGTTVTRPSFWRTPWGAQQDYYVDAVHDGRRIVAVLASDDLWSVSRLHIAAPRDFLSGASSEVTCCGQTRRSYAFPCAHCGQRPCPACGLCRCERVAQTEQLCSGCNFSYRPHLLEGGLCESCR